MPLPTELDGQRVPLPINMALLRSFRHGVGRDGFPSAPNQSADLRRGGREFVDIAEVLIEGPITDWWVVNPDGAAGALPEASGEFAVVHHHHRAVIGEGSA